MAVVKTVADSTIKYRKIQSLIEGKVIYDGKATGRHYEWMQSGAVVMVDEEDVPELLSKRLGGNLCCGGSRDGNLIFEVVGD